MWLSMPPSKNGPLSLSFLSNVEGATRHSDALFGSSGRRTRLRTGFLSESDWPRLTLAAGNLSDAPIFIDDAAALSVLELRAKARRLNAEHGLGMIMIDYLQLMRGRAKSRADSKDL